MTIPVLFLPVCSQNVIRHPITTLPAGIPDLLIDFLLQDWSLPKKKRSKILVTFKKHGCRLLGLPTGESHCLIMLMAFFSVIILFSTCSYLAQVSAKRNAQLNRFPVFFIVPKDQVFWNSSWCWWIFAWGDKPVCKCICWEAGKWSSNTLLFWYYVWPNNNAVLLGTIVDPI